MRESCLAEEPLAPPARRSSLRSARFSSSLCDGARRHVQVRRTQDHHGLIGYSYTAEAQRGIRMRARACDEIEERSLECEMRILTFWSQRVAYLPVARALDFPKLISRAF